MNRKKIEGLYKTKQSNLMKRGGAALALFTFLTANTAVPALADTLKEQPNEKVNNKCNEKNDIEVDKLLGASKEDAKIQASNRVEEVKSDSDQKVKEDIPQGVARNYIVENSNKSYDFDYLNSLDNDELISLIKQITFRDVPGLFEFSDGSCEFFGNKERVQAIIDALQESGQTYTKDDTKGISSLVEFLRAGFYLGFYHQELSYLNDANFKIKTLPAIKAIQENENYGLGSEAQDEVVESLGRFIGNATIDADSINKSKDILVQFIDNFDEFIDQRSKGNAVFETMKGIDYVVYSDLYNNPYDDTQSQYYHKIDAYTEQIERIALMADKMDSSNEWIFNNALYFTARLSKVREDKNISRRVLTEAMKQYPYLSEQYLEAASDLQNYLEGKDADGNTIDYEKVKEAAKEKYLPKVYKFDDDKFVVTAGADVAEEKIKRLYWASKEVRAQYMRCIQNDKELEEGNADDVLNVVIYNSPKEYKLNSKINGLSTDNGGLYIEGTGTFYTYERTEQESIYTLEELFRHEFTHYLQGRYVVPGMWGRGDFYKDGGEKLTWYEEGTAEFFAGSTRTAGVKPRKSVAGNISYERENRMSLPELLHAKYGSWEFYHYGFAFSDYMYSEDMNLFKEMTNYIKNNDVNGYVDYIESLSHDKEKDDKYNKHMDDLLANIDKLDVPLVSDYYTSGQPDKNSNEIYDEITEVAEISNVTTDEEKSQFFNAFDLKGSYIGSRSNGEEADWNDMNKKTDEILKELETKDWSGYKTVTAYFTNYRVNENGDYEYDLVFHGMLKDYEEVKENKLPEAKINSIKKAEEGKEIEFNAENSVDEDGTIKKYEWDFGDGNTDSGVKVKHTFEKEGKYQVRLKVTDNLGGTSETTLDLNVTKHNFDSEIVEKEDNNSFENANKITKADKPIKANMSKEDGQDVFSFDVEKAGNVSIELEKPSNLSLTWVVFTEDNLIDYAAYATKVEPTKLSGEFKVKPGKYYVVVYATTEEEQNGDYNLTVSGDIKEDNDNDGTIEEVESNDSFENAMKVSNKTTVHANISDNDSTDVYTFDIKDQSDINIMIEAEKQVGMNWLLYSADDLSNYACYANTREGKLQNTYNAKPGKYYLYVYKYDKNTSSDYKLTIN